jgi:glutathione gamma-glutamylcysteinyltransferase
MHFVIRSLPAGFSLFFFAILLTMPASNTSLATTTPQCASDKCRSTATAGAPPSSATKTSKRSLPSFYQRPLPDTCVAFSSPRGKDIFRSALDGGGLKSFFVLIDQHTTQTEPAYCGLATLVVALNAMAVDPRQNWKAPWRWYQEELLQCCCDFDLEEVKKRGITLAEFRCLAICQGLSVETQYADDDSTTLESFRSVIRQVCVEDKVEATTNKEERFDTTSQDLSAVLVVTYDRKVIGQTGSGHFSPIAAYDEASDNVLILDTARFKYGSHWVAVSTLFEALKSIDKESGRSRGFALLKKDVTNVEKHGLDESGKPQRLLRVLENQSANSVKSDFLVFLDESRALAQVPEWADFLSFWTRNDTDPGRVWYLCDPVVKPCLEEDIQAVDDALCELRSRMEEHLGRVMDRPSTNHAKIACRPNLSRTIPLLHTEAIYIVYLSSLEQAQPGSVIFHSTLLQSTVATLRDAISA